MGAMAEAFSGYRIDENRKEEQKETEEEDGHGHGHGDGDGSNNEDAIAPTDSRVAEPKMGRLFLHTEMPAASHGHTYTYIHPYIHNIQYITYNTYAYIHTYIIHNIQYIYIHT